MSSSVVPRSLGVVVVCAWLIAAPWSRAEAQDADGSEASETRDAEARARFDAGRLAFGAARYADALADFERAYQLSGRPELLYNMGTCLDRLRRDEEAIEVFSRYLDELPDASNRLEVETRLSSMRASQAERREREAALAHTGDVTPAPERGVETEWWLWTLVGVAVVGAGIGIGVGVAASGETTAAPIPGDVGPGGVVMALVSW